MTDRPIRLLTVAFCLLGLGQGLAAWPATFDPKTMMDTPQIKRGMLAWGKSVFAGGTITSFRLRILDVMKKSNYGGDMILARVLDGPCVQRQSGIIGGMSGSPVYINGRLIGAIAYGWTFSQEPIAGITAIRDMLEALDVMKQPLSAQSALPGMNGQRWAGSAPVTVGDRAYRAAEVVTDDRKLPVGVMALRPVGPAISCSGMGPAAIEFARAALKPYGLEPQASGGGQVKPVKLSLQPGAALGVRMMSGDFDMTGFGTVTYRQGDELLGFGHPMMQRGRVAFPLCTVWVHDFIPSLQRSNKLGAGMTDVGTMSADTAWAVGASIGATPVMRPAEIEVLDRTRNLTKRFRVKVMIAKGVTPGLLASGVASALEASYNPGFEGMVRARFEVRGARGAHAGRSDEFYVGGAPMGAATGDLMAVMQAMEENRWEPQEIESLTFRAELSDADNTAFIEKARAEETVAKAGQPLHLRVQVRPDSAGPREYPVTLNMPRDLPKGALRIAVVGGLEADIYRSRLGILMPTFDNLPAMLRCFEQTEDSHQLCAIVALPGQVMAVGTTRLFRLPDSTAQVFEKSPRTDLERGREELTQSQELPWVVFGRAMLAVPTEDRQGGKGTVTATGGAEPEKPAAAEAKASFSPRPDRYWWTASAYGAPPSEQRPWPAQGDSANKPRPRDPADSCLADKNRTIPPPSAPVVKNPILKEGEAPKPPAEEAATKPILRQPIQWTQAKLTDFVNGTEEGTALRSDGGLSLAPAITELGGVNELYVTAAAVAGPDTFLATASPGRVYKTKPNAQPELHFDTGEFAVKALAADGAGNLYAGTFPGGKVYKIAPDGKGAIFCDLAADYVWALALDPEGRLLAATGPAGMVYAIDAQGQASEWAKTPQTHVMSLLVAGDSLYLGAADSGMVYRRLPDGRLETLYDAGEQDVTCLAADAQGRVYAGLAPQGKIVRLAPDAPPAVVFDDKARPVYSLAFAGAHLYAGTGPEGQLLAVVSDGVHDLVRETKSTHVLALAGGPEGSVLCGLANPGRSLSLSPVAAAKGAFTSAILDAERLARWGLVDWLTDLPAEAKFTLQTRSGNSNDPADGSWSVWSAAYANPGADTIASPAARYLQYRLELEKAPGDGAPFLRRLSLWYLPANQKPDAKFEAPESDKPTRAQVELKWAATDPDKDQLLATIEYRAAGGADWQKLIELPADKKTWKWDTAKVADGKYDVRLTVADEISNPGAGLAATALLYALELDNTKPTLTVTKSAVQDGKLLVEGTAADNLRLVEVAYQKGEQWYGVAAADGRFDSKQEAFSFSVPVADGKAEIKLQARDAAGNVVTETIKP